MVELQSDDFAGAQTAFADPAASHRPSATRTLAATARAFSQGWTASRSAGRCSGWEQAASAPARRSAPTRASRCTPSSATASRGPAPRHALHRGPREVGQRLVTLFSEDVALLDEPEAMLRETLQIAAPPAHPSRSSARLSRRTKYDRQFETTAEPTKR